MTLQTEVEVKCSSLNLDSKPKPSLDVGGHLVGFIGVSNSQMVAEV